MPRHSATPWVVPESAATVLHMRDDASWDALRGTYDSSGRPFAEVLAVARENGCKTVVVEHRYIDRDFRSEHSAFWSLRFQVPSPFTRRVHFFAQHVRQGGLHKLSAPARKSYLGYTVLKPFAPGRVGRTVLAPPPRVRAATLTLIKDTVSLFGNDLEVEGVPFCEQDREYLRCAHAAAWCCHYVAAARGLVGRRPTSNLVALTPADTFSAERALPSKGMSLVQLQGVFGAMDQPALFYGFSNLPDVSGVPTPAPVKHGDDTVAPGFWDTRCISIICRYLNSGFPVLIAGRGHAWVLVGWRRDDTSGHVTFIACDDQNGPYEEIPSPFTHYRAPWHGIMVPLPPKVFLTGESAENDAFHKLRGIWSSSPTTQRLAEALQDGRIQLRTRLKNVRTFKREIFDQTSSDDVLRLIRLARLPQFVWVVEAHVRARCHVEDRCVIATLLYDSTSNDARPGVCSIAVPGAVAVFPPDDAPRQAVRAGIEPWRSMLPVH